MRTPVYLGVSVLLRTSCGLRLRQGLLHGGVPERIRPLARDSFFSVASGGMAALRPVSQRGSLGRGPPAPLRATHQFLPRRRRQVRPRSAGAGCRWASTVYDRVAVHQSRPDGTLSRAGLVTPSAAVLVGYPKLDRLVNGDLRRRRDRRTALGLRAWQADGASTRRPTRRPRRCNIAGEEIVTSARRRRPQRDRQAARSCRSTADTRVIAAASTGGRGLRRLERARPDPSASRTDASPLLAAADVMVTDHSSDRVRVLVLARSAADRVRRAGSGPRRRAINPEKVALLRSAATSLRTAAEAADGRVHGLLAQPAHLSAAAARGRGDVLSRQARHSARRAVITTARRAHAPRSAACKMRSSAQRRSARARRRDGRPAWPARRAQSTRRYCIATYNRASLLDETLTSVRALRVSPARAWEVIVVDNNSTDDTRAVVERHARDFPVPLRYLFEARQGRSSALNAGIAASAARSSR